MSAAPRRREKSVASIEWRVGGELFAATANLRLVEGAGDPLHDSVPRPGSSAASAPDGSSLPLSGWNRWLGSAGVHLHGRVFPRPGPGAQRKGRGPFRPNPKGAPPHPRSSPGRNASELPLVSDPKRTAVASAGRHPPVHWTWLADRAASGRRPRRAARDAEAALARRVGAAVCDPSPCRIGARSDRAAGHYLRRIGLSSAAVRPLHP